MKEVWDEILSVLDPMLISCIIYFGIFALIIILAALYVFT